MSGSASIIVVADRSDGDRVAIGTHGDGMTGIVTGGLAIDVATDLNPVCAVVVVNPCLPGIASITVVERCSDSDRGSIGTHGDGPTAPVTGGLAIDVRAQLSPGGGEFCRCCIVGRNGDGGRVVVSNGGGLLLGAVFRITANGIDIDDNGFICFDQ